jgi:hypothetical protein
VVALCLALPACTGGASGPIRATVTVDTTHPLATVRPFDALGAGLDGQDQGSIPGMYRPGNVAAMQTAGLKSITYRLRTELADEAWHWNPEGTWSDAAHQQGYWTSAPTSSAPIMISYGYRLPRRGNTHDQADDTGYSRIDDGDPTTFWKSNPYLDARFTGEDAALHPQWVLVDLGHAVPVDAALLSWGAPYAVGYSVQYWTGTDDPFSIADASSGSWRDFAQGVVTGGTGGDEVRRVAATPHSTQFVRIRMTKGSGQAPAGSTDGRDGIGFALRELSVGTQDAAGAFHDAMRHGARAGAQSQIYVSSTDPWHRGADLDPNTEQPGFDRVLASGLLNNVPAMVPVPVLFSTPEDGQNELRFLAARRFPVGRVELGEEPDGQNVLPEDYAALYLEWATALHAVDPALQLGGPSLQTGFAEVRVWADGSGETSWLRRLVRYLTQRGAMGELGFFSVEWYPFDDPCSPPAPNLAREPALLASAFRRWAGDGLASVPKVITEYGYSAQAAQAEVDLPGALLNTDFAAQFLSLGGDAAFLYGYEPNVLLKEPGCAGWGNNLLVQSDDQYRILDRVATYHAVRLVTQDWLQPVNEPQQLYRTTVVLHGGPHTSLTAYAVRRPDGRWGMLLLDKDPRRPLTVDVRFTGRGAPTFRSGAHLFHFGPDQYQWRPNGENGRPARSLPPVQTRARAGQAVAMKPYSIAVLVGDR